YYPQDIETAARGVCPDFGDQPGTAFAVPDAAGARLVIVQEVPRGYKAGSDTEVFARVRQAVAEGFDLEVSALVLVRPASIPRASSGKIRRQACQELYQNNGLAVVEELAAASAPAPAPDVTTPEVGTVRRWLVERLARQLHLPP